MVRSRGIGEGELTLEVLGVLLHELPVRGDGVVADGLER